MDVILRTKKGEVFKRDIPKIAPVVNFPVEVEVWQLHLPNPTIVPLSYRSYKHNGFDADGVPVYVEE